VAALLAGGGSAQIGGLAVAVPPQFRNKTIIEINRIGVNAATGVNLVPTDVWNEDWSIVGGRPTNRAIHATNAGLGQPIVDAGIRIGQLIYCNISHCSTTIKPSNIWYY